MSMLRRLGVTNLGEPGRSRTGCCLATSSFVEQRTPGNPDPDEWRAILGA